MDDDKETVKKAIIGKRQVNSINYTNPSITGTVRDYFSLECLISTESRTNP